MLLPVALGAGEQRRVRCRRCHRPLRSAEARALGIGHSCDGKEFAARRFDAAQDTLPGL
jgi:hypothetical protein